MNNDIKLNPNIKELKSLLEQESDIELAILFGSLATDSYSPSSDLDIAIKKRKPLTVKNKIVLIEKMTQITGRAIDLIDLSIVGEPLLGQILKHGIRLIGTPTNYANLALEHIYAQTDFVPYIERALQERRQKWINS